MCAFSVLMRVQIFEGKGEDWLCAFRGRGRGVDWCVFSVVEPTHTDF